MESTAAGWTTCSVLPCLAGNAEPDAGSRGRAWAHKIVLERRKEIASRLLDFEKEGTLTIVETPGADVAAVADIVCEIEAEGLLAEKQAIAVDSVGIVNIVDELTSEDRGIASSASSDSARVGS